MYIILILSVTRGNVMSLLSRDTTDGIRAESIFRRRDYRSPFVCNSRTRTLPRSSLPHAVLRTSHPIFLRIYFPEDVATEIFQGLISPGIALLIQDWEMLHSLLKLFECDSCPNLRKMQDVARCRAKRRELFLYPTSNYISRVNKKCQ